MTLHALVPMLRTWDFPRSLAFYVDVLGFACVAGGADDGWAALQRDGIELMLSAPNAHLAETAAAFTGSLYCRVDDVDGWWARLHDRARVCYPIGDFEHGMREFAVFDDSGYLLQFGRPLDAIDASAPASTGA